MNFEREREIWEERKKKKKETKKGEEERKGNKNIRNKLLM